MFVLPEPVMPKRSLVELLISDSWLRAVDWAEFSLMDVVVWTAGACGIGQETEHEAATLRRCFSTPTGRRRAAQRGRGER